MIANENHSQLSEVLMARMNDHLNKPRRRRPRVSAFVVAAAVVAAAGFLGFRSLQPRLAAVGVAKSLVSSSSADKASSDAVSSASGSSGTADKESSKPEGERYRSEQAVLPSEISLDAAARPFHIVVSIENQNVTIYDANDKVVESFICSTGSPGYDTPKGNFTVYNRGKSFFSQKYSEGGYYWVAFYEDYYFHSVPFDSSGKIIPSVADDLGTQDSHGCVHLTVADSEWMYDNIPNGTKVKVE